MAEAIDDDGGGAGPLDGPEPPSALEPLFVYGVKPDVHGGVTFARDNASVIYPAGCGIAMYDTKASASAKICCCRSTLYYSICIVSYMKLACYG